MSTLKATNLSHASAASPNIVLDSAGKVTFGGAVAGAGLDLITPTSVAGTGVTVSGGAVSIAAATTASVNGCFTATYDNYIIMMNALGSASGQLAYRLRVAGTDASGSNYYSQEISAGAGTVVGGRTGPGTSSYLEYLSTTSTAGKVEFFSPFAATPTRSIALSGHTDAAPSWLSIYGAHTLSTSYDGFTLIPASGTITGTLRVYGLRNS